MSTESTNVKYIIGEDELAILAQEISTQIKLMFTEKTINEINSEEPGNGFTTEKAVSNLVKNALINTNSGGFKFVDSLPLEGPDPADASKSFLTKIDPEDEACEKYTQSIWVEMEDGGKWIDLGQCDFKAEDYLLKEDIKPIPNDNIVNIVKAAFEA